LTICGSARIVFLRLRNANFAMQDLATRLRP